jgi:hypothetical protein
MDAQSYVGGELELFRHVTRWKTYYGRAIGRFIEGDVLEVGAGLGGTSRFLCDGRQRSWTCLEPDAALHAELTEGLKASPLQSPGRALLGTVSSLTRDERFDTILYIDVLEHIEDDRRELAESAAGLRAGGQLIVLAPAHQSLFSAFDRAIGHFRRYDRASLSALAPPGLAMATSFYLDAAGMTASLANRLLLRAALPTQRQLMFWDRVLVPVSRVIDPLLAHRVGKSVVAVWKRAA